MDKRLLQDFAVWAKDNLEKQIEVSLKTLGINSDKDIKASKVMGDVTVIDGDAASYPASLHYDRQRIITLVKTEGFEHVVEEFAYTWFNRLVALRFMEAHGFLSHGFRVLTDPSGSVEPEIMKNLAFVCDDIGLDMETVSSLKDAGKIEELYRYVLFCQCNALSGILPMLFSAEEKYLQLLLPRVLLKGETVVTRLAAIPEEYFLEDVEIIGWLYQFYLSVKKDKVNASKKTITKDTLPAVTQLFTPEWIVRYMTENSLGRLWLESYPDSRLRDSMEYFVPDPEQTDEVKAKIEEIRYKNVNPKDIKIIEPCCGSGHILVYLFDLLYKIYEEKGYMKKDIPTLILQNNLHGLDVDKRASQLAAFSLVMKARSVNPQFFRENYYTVPKVYEIHDSTLLLNMNYKTRLEEIGVLDKKEIAEIGYIIESFRYGKTVGSLLKLEKIDFELVDSAVAKIKNDVVDNLFIHEFITDGVELLEKLITQAKILRSRYMILITNPPYLSPSKMEQPMKDYANKNYPFSKTDMFAMFMETPLVEKNGFTAMINMHSWMFLSSFEKLRENLLQKEEIITMAHLGAHAFETIGGEVVQTTVWITRKAYISDYKSVFCRLIAPNSQQEKEMMFLNKENRFISKQDNFSKIPGFLFAYWVSDKIYRSFNNKKLGFYYTTREGMATADNDRFLRLWFEVNIKKVTLSANKYYLGMKWVPYSKGGEFRKWYGNNDYLVDWTNDGFEIKNNKDPQSGRIRSHNYNGEYSFKEGATWSAISTDNISIRYSSEGFLFDSKGAKGFSNSNVSIYYFISLVNSTVAKMYLSFLSPTIDFKVGDIIQIPIIDKVLNTALIENITKFCVDLSKSDWDSFETSWDFKKHPLL